MKGLSGADFSYADLSKAFLHSADLTNTVVEGTSFFDANMIGITMDNCRGKNARFHFARLWDGKFRNVVLKNAMFFNSEVCDCDFTGADLEETCFYLSDMDNTIFRDMNLRDAGLSYTYRTYNLVIDLAG